MRKFVVGIAIFGIFIMYSLGIRHQQPVVGKPTSVTVSNQPPSSGKGTTITSGGTPPAKTVAQYKDGTYTGSSADAYYGNVQVAATVQNGKITEVKFLQYPDTHQTSVYINQQAMPYLQQEAIQAQSSHVNVITGATFTSQAFMQSLAVALSQA